MQILTRSVTLDYGVTRSGAIIRFMKNRIAVGYVRVSTEQQQWRNKGREKTLGESPSRQIELIKRYCKLYDLELKEIIEEQARSGRRKNLNKTIFEERPDYARLVEHLESGEVTHVIAGDLSRLGRDLLESLYFYRYFIKANGVTLITLLEGIDTSRSADEDKIYMHLFLNHFESKRISERTKQAFTYIRSQNRSTGGDAPFGFRTMGKNRKLIPIKSEQSVIRTVKRLKNKNYNYQEIADYLKEKNIKNRSGTNIWYRQQIKRIALIR
jgi:site-specific DNA recombinase